MQREASNALLTERCGLLPTLMEDGSCTGPPALWGLTKEATPKDVSGAGWKNWAFWAFHAPFSGSGLRKQEGTLSQAGQMTLEDFRASIAKTRSVPQKSVSGAS